MKNKQLVLLFCMLLIASTLPAIGMTEQHDAKTVTILAIDQLDQQSSQSDKVYAIGASDRELAQSFKPTLPVLTRVILRLKSTGVPEFYYYYVDIKSSYVGSALATASIHRSEIIVGTGFYEFDFTDLSVSVGSTYYIVLRGVSDAPDTSRVYWWYGHPSPYNRGDAWYESISGWNYLQEGVERCDYVFQTYGTEDNNPPYAPSQPTGPTAGMVGQSYFYSTSAIDPDGDQIQYGWDWDGDNIVDEYSSLMNSGNVDSRNHAWSYPGTYYVKVKTKDEHGALSGFSGPLEVTISEENNPPNIPDRPSGATDGITGTTYYFSTVTTDPDGDQVSYMFDWGDGTIGSWDGPHNSGVTAIIPHSWSADGTYPIKVKAKDINDAESDWSDTFSVSMPKTKDINRPFIRLLENYPNLFIILERLLQLPWI